MKIGFNSSCFIALLLVADIGQAETLEARLRTQLRNIAQQLQQVQSQQAQLMAVKAAAEAERDALKRDLAALSAAEKLQRTRAQTLASEQQGLREQINDSHQQVANVQAAFQALQQQADRLKTDGVTMAASLKTRDAQLEACSLKNQQMYRAGRELLSAYETFGSGDILAIRQPFAGQARVEFDEYAQALGDRLYQSQVAAASNDK